MDKDFIKDQAESCKRHLEKYPAAVADIYGEANDLEKVKEIFLEIVGAALIKRIKFLPNRY